MKRLAFFASSLLAAGVASAQSVGADIQPSTDEIPFLGTYHVATGIFEPANGPVMHFVAPAEIYDNTCPTPNFSAILNGSTVIDEGRIPSTTSPAPNTGTQNNYRVTTFQIGYCTRDLTGVFSVRVRFWQDYDDCATLAAAGTPTADINLTGLPGTATTGTLACGTVDIDLTGGFEFCMAGDANGVFDNSATLDGFGYGLQMNGQTGTTTTATGGFLLAGDLTAPGDCAAGSSTYYNTPGATNGTGLDNGNLFYRDGQGGQSSGCLFFGNPPTVHAGYYMKIIADLDACAACTGNPDTDGDATPDCADGCPSDPAKTAPGNCGCGNVETGDTDGDGVFDCVDNCVSIANPSQADCDADNVGDACEIAAGAFDTNGDTIPDACQQGLVFTYCTTGISTNGCVPTLSTTGTPSAAATNGFVITCSNLEGQKQSLAFYGVSGPKATIWAPGSTSYLCVKSPVKRIDGQNTGGTAGLCDGTYSTDWLDYIANHPVALGVPFSAGDVVNLQVWYRDPSAPQFTNLSGGLQWTMAP